MTLLNFDPDSSADAILPELCDPHLRRFDDAEKDTAENRDDSKVASGGASLGAAAVAGLFSILRRKRNSSKSSGVDDNIRGGATKINPSSQADLYLCAAADTGIDCDEKRCNLKLCTVGKWSHKLMRRIRKTKRENVASNRVPRSYTDLDVESGAPSSAQRAGYFNSVKETTRHCDRYRASDFLRRIPAEFNSGVSVEHDHTSDGSFAGSKRSSLSCRKDDSTLNLRDVFKSPIQAEHDLVRSFSRSSSMNDVRQISSDMLGTLEGLGNGAPEWAKKLSNLVKRVAQIFGTGTSVCANCRGISWWATDVQAAVESILGRFQDEPSVVFHIENECIESAEDLLLELLAHAKQHMHQGTLPLFAKMGCTKVLVESTSTCLVKGLQEVELTKYELDMLDVPILLVDKSVENELRTRLSQSVAAKSPKCRSSFSIQHIGF